MERKDFIHNLHVFPRIHIEKRGTSYKLTTMLRKKHTDGKWYKWLATYVFKPISTRDELVEKTAIFTELCYKEVMLHKIDLSLVVHDTMESVYVFDSDQDEEQVRIEKVVKIEIDELNKFKDKQQ